MKRVRVTITYEDDEISDSKWLRTENIYLVGDAEKFSETHTYAEIFCPMAARRLSDFLEVVVGMGYLKQSTRLSRKNAEELDHLMHNLRGL